MEDNFGGIPDMEGLQELINQGIIQVPQEEKSEETKVVSDSEDVVEEAKKDVGVDIDVDVKYPRVVIPRSDLVQALNLASVIINPSSPMVVPQSLTIVPLTEGRVNLFATNDMNVFTYTVNTGLNDTDMLQEKIALPSTLLTKLMPMIGNRVMIFRNNDEADTENYNKLFIRLMDGDLVLDVKVPEETMFDQSMEKGDLVSTLDLNTLGNIVKTMLPLVNLDVRPANQKISFLGKEAYYNSSIYVIKGDIESPNLILKRLDCEYIKRLSNLFKGNTISLYKVKNSEVDRIIVECGSTNYMFINGEAKADDRFTKVISSIEDKTLVNVKYNQLLRVTNLSVVLPYSVGRIGFRYTKDCLEASIPTKKGISYFDIDYSDTAPDVETKEPILIPANELKKLLQSFNNVTDISICIENNMVIVKHDKFVAVFMHTL